ncbi:MAG TPA: metallophosphoesterase [Polyangiaceae bacterium]
MGDPAPPDSPPPSSYAPPPPPARWRLFAFAAVLTAGIVVDVCALWPWLDDRLRLVEMVTVGQYVVLAGVSVFTAQWPVILAVNVVAGASYRVATRWQEERLLTLRVVVVNVNRNLGHLEALFPWIVLSVAFPSPYIPWTLRTGLLGALVLFAAGWMDWLTAAGRRHGWLRAASADPVHDRWRHQLQRRLLLMGGSVLGFVILALVAWSQILSILPLLLAFVPGIAFRLADLREDPSRKLGPAQKALLARVLRVADWADFGVLVASQVLIAAMVWAGLHPGVAADGRDTKVRAMPAHVVPDPGGPSLPSVAALAAAPTAPKDPPIRLFVVADSQLHELSGQRSGVQLDIADAIINVAVRPVELDLLSMFSVARFERARRALETRYSRPLPWVHLGDFADLGCESELSRFPAVGAAFEAPLAVAVGNHDSAFCGNFAWHPSWDPACGAKPRATKAWSDHLFHGWSKSNEELSAWGTPYLPAVVSLGHVDGAEVVGVFVDTSDFTMPSLGMAGLQGDVSGAQETWIHRRMAEHPGAYVVFFMHHPFAELSLRTRWRMGRIIDRHGDRVLGIVSAHTHLAALRWSPVGSRSLPEFVVGSTIDPPQEGAVLEIGRNAGGRMGMRVVTVQTVTREGVTCGEEAAGVPHAVCEGLWSEVQAKCRDLATAAASDAHPRTPADVKAEQQARAKLLLACLPRLGLPRLGSPSTPGYPLDDPTVVAGVDDAARRLLTAEPAEGDDLDRLACLSWVGSVLQRHKTDATFHAAFAEATSPGAVSPATEMVADATGGVQRACSGPIAFRR